MIVVVTVHYKQCDNL